MGIKIGEDIQYVHPTFLYESLADFIIFFILIKLSQNRKYSGQITVWYFTLYSFIRFFIEGLRSDSLVIGNIRISQIVSGVIFIFAIVFMIKLKKQQK